MLYLVRGNAVQIFSAFGQQVMIEAATDATDILEFDLKRTHFLGTTAQATQFFNAWDETVSGQYYTQGNMSGGILCCLLGAEPLRKQDETEEAYYKNYARQAFAYVNDNQQVCGFMMMYRRDNPSQWMMGVIKKATACPADREITLISSFDLTPLIRHPEFGVSVTPSITPLSDLCAKELKSKVPTDLLLNAFLVNQRDINPHFDRINFLMRVPSPAEQGMMIRDPLNFSELNLSLLFAENPVWDLFKQYTILPTFAMLVDCLSDKGLGQELQKIQLIDNKRLHGLLIRMTMVFYEEGILEENRELLTNLELIQSLSALMWNAGQIKLIPFMLKKNYSQDLMTKILNKDSYYEALNRLVQLDLTQEIPSFFDMPEKLEELERLMEQSKFTTDDCKALCLIFWYKGSLTTDEYNKLIEETKRYPLMASTVIALDKKNIVVGGMDGLYKLATTSRHHLKKTLVHHFFAEKKDDFLNTLGFYNLSLEQLKQSSKALNLLKEIGIEGSDCYEQVINTNESGQALRIFLPELATVPNHFKKALISLLYTGINLGTAIQGKELFKIKDKELLVLAKKLCDRFFSVKQLQNLSFPPATILWAAQNTAIAMTFHQIISKIEEQCNKISNLLSSPDDQALKSLWERELMGKGKKRGYRQSLYALVYEALKNAEGNRPSNFVEIREKLKREETRILKYIDLPIESPLHKAFMVITNILITALTLALANYIKYKTTGNCWFFNQTRAGEELRQLTQGIMTPIM